MSSVVIKVRLYSVYACVRACVTRTGACVECVRRARASACACVRVCVSVCVCVQCYSDICVLLLYLSGF